MKIPDIQIWILLWQFRPFLFQYPNPQINVWSSYWFILQRIVPEKEERKKNLNSSSNIATNSKFSKSSITSDENPKSKKTKQIKSPTTDSDSMDFDLGLNTISSENKKQDSEDKKRISHSKKSAKKKIQAKGHSCPARRWLLANSIEKNKSREKTDAERRFGLRTEKKAQAK